MDLRLLEDHFRYFAVLAGAALDQIHHVVDAAGLESIFLLFVPAIHD